MAAAILDNEKAPGSSSRRLLSNSTASLRNIVRRLLNSWEMSVVGQGGPLLAGNLDNSRLGRDLPSSCRSGMSTPLEHYSWRFTTRTI